MYRQACWNCACFIQSDTKPDFGICLDGISSAGSDEEFADAIRQTTDVCPVWEWDGSTEGVMQDDSGRRERLGCYVIEEIAQIRC